MRITNWRIRTRVMEVNQKENNVEDFSLMVRQISIDKLQEEPRKLGPNIKAPLIQKNHNEALYSLFVKELLQPKDG